jgi:Rieske Fe-S protein
LLSTVTMGGGLLAGYGAFAKFAIEYLYSADETSVWQFIGRTTEFRLGDARQFATPSGAKIVVARQSAGDGAEAFAALSSICPHLGCQVHWEAQNNRFFCPCHNGAFDPSGKATAGPPAQANQSLVRFELKVENGLLYVRIPARSLSLEQDA